MYVKRIKELRGSLGLSVPKLAERINIKARTIVSYEAGRIPSLEFAAQLYKVYNVNLNWFVSGDGEMFIGQQAANHTGIDEDQFRKLFKQCMKDEGFI